MIKGQHAHGLGVPCHTNHVSQHDPGDFASQVVGDAYMDVGRLDATPLGAHSFSSLSLSGYVRLSFQDQETEILLNNSQSQDVARPLRTRYLW